MNRTIRILYRYVLTYRASIKAIRRMCCKGDEFGLVILFCSTYSCV